MAQKNYVVGTGGKVDGMVEALIKKAADPDKAVQATIFQSLYEIGRKQPNLHLSSILDFMRKNPNLDQKHRIILLKSLQKVLKGSLDAALPDVCMHLVDLGLSEMLAKKEVIQDWQGEACELLIILGTKYSTDITKKLIEQFPPGKIPHYYVMKLLGDLATHVPLEVVPLLKDVIARTVPVTASVKKENMRWVFAYAISHFCEAIVHFIANADHDEFGMQFASFSSELYPSYEIMLNLWLNSKEANVRLMSAKAIGNLCAILPRDQFDAQIGRLFPPILALYKKEKDVLPVTQAVCNILEVGVQSAKAAIAEAEADPNAFMPTLALEPMLPTVLNVIHPLAMQPVNEANPNSIKNNNELLRCHEVIGYAFPNSLISYLLDKLDITRQKDPLVRAGTLLIIRHLVDRIDSSLEDHKELLVIGMKAPCEQERDARVKKVLGQVIISMSSKHYLELEGGEILVDFIVRHCAIPDSEVVAYENAGKSKPHPAGMISPEELRSMCDDILNISATAVPCMEKVLWPYMFEYTAKKNYINAIAIISKSIGAVAAKKREEWEAGTGPTEADKDFYMIDFDRHVNCPRPPAVVARLLVAATGAQRRNKQGENVLACLKACGPVLHPEVQNLWDHALDKLVSFIQTKSANWKQTTWEDLVLRLMAETIKIVADDSWTMRLGEELSLQLPDYNDDPEMKKNALKQLGLILQKLNHKEFIRRKLELMFTSTNHANDEERMGCAQGFGYCSATHLDMALEKVQEQLKPKQPEKKKSSGFFSNLFSSDAPKGPPEEIVRTCMLCFGYITAYAPPKLITSRLEVTILVSMRPYLESKKTTLSMQQALIQTIDLLAKTVHPTHLKVDQFIFKARDELLNHVLEYITNPNTLKGDTTFNLRVVGLNACTTLVNLEPALSEDMERSLVTKIVQFYHLAARGEGEEGKEEGAEKDKKEKGKVAPLPEGHAQNLKLLYENMNELLSTILYMNTTIPCLVRLLMVCKEFANHKSTQIRKRALHTILFLLEKFVEYKTTDIRSAIEDKFDNIGQCLAIVIPRVTDSNKLIRVAALQSTQQILFIDYFLRNGPSEAPAGEDEENVYQVEMPDQLVALAEMVGRVESSELPTQFGAANEMASIVCEVVAEDELTQVLMHLLTALTDADPSASSGTCIVLNAIIKLRGDQFLPQVGELIAGMLLAMEKVNHEKTINGTLHSIRTLATHHPIPVIDQLLASSMPFNKYVVSTLQTVSKDEELREILMDHLIEIINDSQLVIDSTPSREAIAATTALGSVIEVLPQDYVDGDRYAQLIGTLFLRFGTTCGVKTPKPREDLLQTLTVFLKRTEDDKSLLVLTNKAADASSETTYPKLIFALVACACERKPEEIHNLYNFLLPYLKGNFKGQRLVVVSVYAETMNHIEDEALIQNIINALLTSMIDEALKLQSIIGLGNVASAGSEMVNKFAPAVIDALMSTIDDKEEPVCMESMNGLDKVFQEVEASRVQPILINIIHRIRPHLEKPSAKIRASSFRLFGTLSRFGHGAASEVFLEQMHSTMPSILVHLKDPDQKVQIACKQALRKMSPLLGVPEIDAIIQRKWFDPNIKLPYDRFADEFSAKFVNALPERAGSYIMSVLEFFQSKWVPLRTAAATLAGSMLGHLPPSARGSINMGIVSTAFVTLLTGQKDAEVRNAAAASMRLMYDY